MRFSNRFLLIAVALTTGCIRPATQGSGDDDSGGGDYSTPGTIVINSGNNQTAPVGTPFPQPLSVTVFTPDDLKCNGCLVTWTLSPGSFSSPVSAPTAITGIEGLNVQGLSPAGTYSVRASIDDGSSVTFTLVAR